MHNDENHKVVDAQLSRRLEGNLRAVRERMAQACRRAGRGREDVRLVAVSKTHSPEMIRGLFAAGQRDFGESYVQEWQDKVGALRAVSEAYEEINWHFIGHLQSNKARDLAGGVGLVHSADRRSVMRQLHRRFERPANILLQVNIAGQSTKSGVAPEGLPALLETAYSFENLRIRGLMCIPPYADDPQENRPYFRRMRALFEQSRRWLASRGEGARGDALADFEHLSMGMSGDFEVAIEEGATIVRVGTALFGARDYED